MQLHPTRREFVEFLSGGVLTLTAAGQSLHAFGAAAVRPFTPVAPTTADALTLAPELEYSVIVKFGDRINKNGETFGYDNDFTAFKPLSDTEGLLWVNHEFVNPLFVSGYAHGEKRTRAQIDQEQLAVGGSIIKIRRDPKSGRWQMVADDPLNRRVSGKTRIPFAGGVSIAGSRAAIGTLGNCSGGFTPWGTVLTCEENFWEFYGDVTFEQKDGKRTRTPSGQIGWDAFDAFPPEHYGWVVEINCLTGEAQKLTALGRFCHEGAKVVQAKDGRAAVYLGDDTADQCLYKFIAEKPGSLVTGQLYVADTAKGRWLPLSIDANPELKKHFKDQTELLTFTRVAAKMAGGTPLNRPEGIDVHPLTGAVIVSLSMNQPKGDMFGSLLKLEEKNADPLALEFKATTLLAGGETTGFAAPDNILFDKSGNLWLCCDVSEKNMHKDPYTPYGNNGLYFIPMAGGDAGKPVRIASGPTDAELTGPSWAPDGRTLFLSVQHPGNSSKSLKDLTSHWPDGNLPRPAVVAISPTSRKTY